MKEELGTRWLQPDLFRFGASSLLTDIERQLEHHVTGAYSASFRHAMPCLAGPRRFPADPMPTVTEILATMDYGPSPESAAPRRPGSTATAAASATSSAAAGCGQRTSTPSTRRTARRAGQVAQARRPVDRRCRPPKPPCPPGSAGRPRPRARVLYALARALQKHARLFAVLETLDNGKPIRETRDVDVPLAVRHFYHHAGWAQLLSETSRHEALGVVGQIVPWNFPLLMLAWKIAPALACGNTVVFKPAEQTSLSALLFAEICTEVGLPAGVVNIVTGDGAVGAGHRRAPAHRQDRLHRQHRGRPRHPPSPPPAAARSSAWSWAASRPTSSLPMPTSTLPSKAWSTASSSTRARCAAPAAGCWCTKARPPRLLAKLKARMAKIRVGAPLDKNPPTWAALVSREQCSRVSGLCRARPRRRRQVHQASAGALPGRRWRTASTRPRW
jgi:aldehyde dehydrogenase (NAD+)